MITEIAKKLELDRSSAWRRVRSAIERGYAKNLEDRKGRPARLVPGDPLPGTSRSCRLPSGCRVARLQAFRRGLTRTTFWTMAQERTA